MERPKPNYLKIQIQPNEGMWFDLQAKRPGPELVMENVELGFAYKDFFKMTPATGYETLIYDCLTGDQTLFQRADNIENGWRAVQPFLDAWATGKAWCTSTRQARMVLRLVMNCWRETSESGIRWGDVERRRNSLPPLQVRRQVFG